MYSIIDYGAMIADKVRMDSHEKALRVEPEQLADFKQSTFLGVPFSRAQLRKQAASHVPVLDEEGQIDRQILTLMDGTIALEQIARRIRNLFPACFPSQREAFNRVSALSLKYSR
jgi:hypothetical protein